jgi:amino-acid N-acetyltransferase
MNILNGITIRKAAKSDISAIFDLLYTYAKKGLLLPPCKENISSRLGTFIVAVCNEKVIACASLRDFDNRLFEVRSLAVNTEFAGKQIGSKLVTYLLTEFKIPGGSRIFALTYRSTFFERLGFKCVSKKLFPEKIWHDCEKCPKKDHCDEQAVMMTTPIQEEI